MANWFLSFPRLGWIGVILFWIVTILFITSEQISIYLLKLLSYGVGVGVHKLFCAELRHLRRSFEDFSKKSGYWKIQHKMRHSESGKNGTFNRVSTFLMGRGGSSSWGLLSRSQRVELFLLIFCIFFQFKKKMFLFN